ncbi:MULTISPECIES: hypothetical protein [unclassified Paenibacillus]|uniref:hypothetical protein n=1 Tax=unclassified Paenibacillus TaxID=185978 RepID=UPI00070DD0E9|nr:MULTISPECIES: hypothetical protein [unclassified Paenibacillus]KQX69283.1 hypothetical protein ASD40_01930 [Paenibacillus sp. Root444D2]
MTAKLSADKSFPCKAIGAIPKAQVSRKGLFFSSFALNPMVTQEDCRLTAKLSADKSFPCKAIGAIPKAQVSRKGLFFSSFPLKPLVTQED